MVDSNTESGKKEDDPGACRVPKDKKNKKVLKNKTKYTYITHNIVHHIVHHR